jgi:3'-phosphoadenosine 5'-phosphosulfate sulfotransferase (PAPS reductase)/FAD synthetase
MKKYDNTHIYEKGLDIVVSVSGGKDSTACALHCIDRGLEFKNVFADTGWEHDSTYEFLHQLEKKIGTIHRVKKEIPVKEDDIDFVNHIEEQLGFHSAFVRHCVRWKWVPSGTKRSCTRELKIHPIKKWVNENTDVPIVVTGIRHEESLVRSKIEEWEWVDMYDGYAWRPVIQWTLEDVIKIHKRHNFEPNRLYYKNHDRVGCFPCIYVSKNNIKHLTKKRIDIIKQLEEYLSEKKGKPIQFFYNGSVVDLFEWSQTTHGGKQFELFPQKPQRCMKWGFCVTE